MCASFSAAPLNQPFAKATAEWEWCDVSAWALRGEGWQQGEGGLCTAGQRPHCQHVHANQNAFPSYISGVSAAGLPQVMFWLCCCYPQNWVHSLVRRAHSDTLQRDIDCLFQSCPSLGARCCSTNPAHPTRLSLPLFTLRSSGLVISQAQPLYLKIG